MLAEGHRADVKVGSSWYPTRVFRDADGNLKINVQGASVAALRRRGLAVKAKGVWGLTQEGWAVVEGQLETAAK